MNFPLVYCYTLHPLRGVRLNHTFAQYDLSELRRLWEGTLIEEVVLLPTEKFLQAKVDAAVPFQA